MIDLDRLRNARDADYETGSTLCREAADELEKLRGVLWIIHEEMMDIAGDIEKDLEKPEAVEQ